jgi:hypothetical protein
MITPERVCSAGAGPGALLVDWSAPADVGGPLDLLLPVGCAPHADTAINTPIASTALVPGISRAMMVIPVGRCGQTERFRRIKGSVESVEAVTFRQSQAFGQSQGGYFFLRLLYAARQRNTLRPVALG